jgi:hypothetical protein
MISVSKLCCPVCWELFKVLDLVTEIRGFHPTVTPLALPDTFPPEIYEKMTARFRDVISFLLKSLLLDPDLDIITVKSIGNRRNESETGHSAASSNESAPKYDSCNKFWDD